MDALRKDLEGTGWTLAPATASAAGPREIAAAGVSREAAPSVADTEANREGPRGMILSKQEILWIVAEKWEEEWVIPSDRHDPHGIFALSVLEEFQDYETSLRMPGPGTIAVDDRGEHLLQTRHYPSRVRWEFKTWSSDRLSCGKTRARALRVWRPTCACCMLPRASRRAKCAEILRSAKVPRRRARWSWPCSLSPSWND